VFRQLNPSLDSCTGEDELCPGVPEALCRELGKPHVDSSEADSYTGDVESQVL